MSAGASWAPVPIALIEDRALSLGAKALYPLLRRIAWERGDREDDPAPVELVSVDEIARRLGAGRSATQGYLRELETVRWIAAFRATRNRPRRYLIGRNSPLTDAEILEPIDWPVGWISTYRASRDNRAKDLDLSDDVETTSSSAPPDEKKSRPRDPLFDAVVAHGNVLLDDLTDSALADLGRTVRELRGVAATPRQVEWFATVWWPDRYPDATLTHRCFRKYWESCASEARRRAAQDRADRESQARAGIR